MTLLPRPHVTCHMLSAVDGRIVNTIWNLRGSSTYFEQTAAKIKVDAWIVGRTTMQEFSSKRQRPRKGRFTVPPGDFVAQKSKTYAVGIDPDGKCRWDTNMTSSEHVIEVLTEEVSAEYLDHLRSKKVSYVFGGKQTLDLARVLHKLRTLFGIRRVRLDGGGRNNGSFLKAGLVDELSLVVAPLADGTIGTPAVFDAQEGYGRRRATHFRLKSANESIEISSGFDTTRFRADDRYFLSRSRISRRRQVDGAALTEEVPKVFENAHGHCPTPRVRCVAGQSR